MAGAARMGRAVGRLLASVLLLLLGAPLAAEPLTAVALEPGTVRHVELPVGVLGWIGTLEVPRQARALSIAVHAKDDLDLYLRRGRPFGGDFAAEADVLPRPAKAPIESLRVTGPLTPGRWYVAVVRHGAGSVASPFDILAFVDEQNGDEHTLLPSLSDRIESLRTPSGVSARTWFPEGAKRLSFSFTDGAPPAGAPYRLVGPVGALSRTWEGTLTLERDQYPAGMYSLQWDPAVAAKLPGRMRLHVDLGTGRRTSSQPARVPSIAPTLRFDRPLTVRLGGDGAVSWNFRVDVPRGTSGFVIEATAQDDADVDLFANRGNKAPEDEENADYFSRTLDAVELLTVAGDRSVRPGPFTGTALLVDDEKATTVRLRARLLKDRTRERTWGEETPPALPINTWRRGTLEANESPVAWYLVTIPPGTRAFHALVVQASAPVELVLVRRTDGSVMRRAMTARVDERLDIPFTTALDSPRYFVLGVYARDPYDGRVNFRVAISVNKPLRPPADMRWPPFLETANGRTVEKAASAVVELTVRGNTGGTGTCVTPTGRIITCRHVLQAEGEEKIQRRGVLVGFTSQVDRPPTQAYVARVVQESEEWDLAMLEITEDVFGRPVGRDVRFPWIPMVNTPVRLGDRVAVLGFPADGSDRSRTPIIYSPGVVAGLEAKGQALRWIKTDAWIASGHSGGALIDPAGRLIGIPAATLGDLEDLGLAIPISALPQAWRRRIQQDLPK